MDSLIDRINLLLKNGVVTKDFLASTAEAAAITGLSVPTICIYAQSNQISHFSYPGKNLYPLKELCQWVDQHYQKATILSTYELNGGYKSTKKSVQKKGRSG